MLVECSAVCDFLEQALAAGFEGEQALMDHDDDRCVLLPQPFGPLLQAWTFAVFPIK